MIFKIPAAPDVAIMDCRVQAGYDRPPGLGSIHNVEGDNMKKLKWSLLLVLIAGLALCLGACGDSTEATASPEARATEAAETEPQEAPSIEPTNTEAAKPTTPPTDTAVPEPTEEEELKTSALVAPSDLSSYRSTMRMTMRQVQDGKELEQSMVFEIEYTREPKVQHITVSGEGLEAEMQSASLEMYVAEDTMYMKLEDQWLGIPATEDETGAENIITPDTLLEGICGWKKEGRTEVNGVQVQHWTISKEDMEGCMPPEELAGLGELDEAGGDLYVAEDDNYVVQMDLFYEGDDLDLNLGTTEEDVKIQRVEIHYTMADVNEPFIIQVPEEALDTSASPDDIPIPEDAEEVSNMFGILTFTSPSTIEEIAEFYQTEMPENGWSETSVNDMSGTYTAEYTKEGRTANLMITTGDAGKTSVMIAVQDSN
jgi:hypothetical protein